MNIYQVTIDKEQMTPERYAAVRRVINSSGRLDERGYGFYFSNNGLGKIKGIRNHPGVEMQVWAENATHSDGLFVGRRVS
jgi:hypothetical protein